jgi:hypothetical protein
MQSRTAFNYVRFAAAFENVPLTAVASPPIDPMAARDIRTSRSAYSVRSWPSSSRHSFIKRFFIVLPFFRVIRGCGSILEIALWLPTSVELRRMIEMQQIRAFGSLEWYG